MAIKSNGMQKGQLVDKILANDTYMPNSGLIQNLRRSLLKLSYSDLSNLALVIQIKERDIEIKRGA